MSSPLRPFAVAACALAAVVLTTPRPASAVVRSSSISAPGDPTFRTYDADLGPDADANALLVTGRAASTAPATDKVDLRCFWTDSGGDLRANPVALRLPLAPDGSFAVTVDPASLSDNPFGSGSVDDASGVQTCRLRATPPATALTDLDTAALADFAGPRVNVARFGSSSLPVRGGGNVTVDFSVGTGGLRGQAEWASAAGCGPFSFRPLVNPAALSPATFPNWDCVLAILPPGASDGASQLVVDGRNAYTASSAPALDFDGDSIVERPAGAAGLEVAYRRSAADGTVSTTERAPVTRCDQPGFPPTTASCRTLVGTGLAFERTVVLGADGLEATVIDVLRSTDGLAHAVDLTLKQYVVFDNDPVFRFPGQDAFAPWGPGDQPPLGPSGPPATVLTRDAITPDTTRQGAGAETWAQRPDDVRFFGADYRYAERFVRAVPAGGTVALTHVFREGRSTFEAALGARAAEDRLQGPTVVLTGPAEGSTVRTPQITVTGRATDSVGVASLTANGQAVALGAGGSFAAPVTLTPGRTTVTIVARDQAGNAAQTALTVTYAPVVPPARCVVPRVGRGSLYGTARSKIKRAGCRVGTVRRVRSSTRRGRVVRLFPPGGRRVSLGTRVRIDLSDGKAPKPRRRTAKTTTKRAVVQVRRVTAHPRAATANARPRR